MFKIILPSIKFKIERWKYNEEYKVYVSTLGNFKDENKKNIKLLIGSNGYCMINTWKGFKAAHRLVLMTYKPVEAMDILTVDHLNHNKRNNELSNLEWVSEELNLTRAQEDFVQLQINNQQKIISGKQKFNNIDEAIDYIINTQVLNGSIPNRDNIKKKINKAITTKSLYCNRKWSFI